LNKVLKTILSMGSDLWLFNDEDNQKDS
jgi:hypothetical protein